MQRIPVYVDSVEGIWLTYRAGLFSFIRSRVRNDDLAEDILQDVFLKIQSRLSTLSSAERIQNWLYRIARNTIIDHYRTDKKFDPLPSDLRLDQDLGNEFLVKLEKCVPPLIAMLPEPYRDAVSLFELEGLPLNEVAAHLGISLAAAKSRVRRGRAKFKEILFGCCRFEFDSRGNPVDWTPKGSCCRINC